MSSQELFLAWVAGFFDGEGCICAANHPNGPSLRVNIAQKNRLVLELIQQRLGGKIYTRKVDGCSQLWYQNKEELKTFLTAISPYVILRKSEVDIALRFYEDPLGKQQVIEDLHAASLERRK